MICISSRLHGALDYGVACLLIASPWLFRFADGGVAMWTPIALGIAAILYSLCTDYELGMLKKIPFKIHLIIDSLSAVLLWISPWLFGFHKSVVLPHMIIGVVELVVVVLTDKITSTERPITYS